VGAHLEGREPVVDVGVPDEEIEPDSQVPVSKTISLYHRQSANASRIATPGRLLVGKSADALVLRAVCAAMDPAQIEWIQLDVLAGRTVPEY
jgi:predicted amidohydrolase YtcJ